MVTWDQYREGSIVIGDTHLYMGVSKNMGKPPKSSILIEFSIINHPFWGTHIFGNTQIFTNHFRYLKWRYCTL